MPSARAAQVPANQAACIVESPILRARVNAILAEPAVARAHWGLLVFDSDGQCLLSQHATQFFHPASTAKLLTTATAMSLDPAATVTTRLQAQGTLAPAAPSTEPPTRGSARVLTGNLVLVGAGDSTFATEDVPYHEPAPPPASPPSSPPTPVSEPPLTPHPLLALESMADTVVAAGITAIDGDVVGDDTRFAWEPIPEAWAADDLLWGYGAPVSALSVHDNQILIRIRPGAQAGDPGLVETEAGMPAWWTIDAGGLRTTVPGTGSHVAFDRVPDIPRTLRIWGTIAADAPEITEHVALPDPAQFAAEALRGMLLARGIRVSGVARAQHRLLQSTESFRAQLALPAQPSSCAGEGCTCTGPQQPLPTVLAQVQSPPLADDILATNKDSLNLHAELFLERMGLAGGAAAPWDAAQSAPDGRVLLDQGSRAAGLRVVRSVLAGAGVDPDDISLVDGSGLSMHDLVTPRAMVRLLLWARQQPWFAAWQASMPVAGVDGTLAGRFAETPVRGKLFAKTGTLGESRALTGYLQCASGRNVALSIMVDNHAPGTAADRQAMDRLVEAIYRAE